MSNSRAGEKEKTTEIEKQVQTEQPEKSSEQK